MVTNQFVLEPMAEVDFQITYNELDAESKLNHNEAHIHSECEIYLNLSGDVFFEVEDRMYPISRGSVVITRPYEYHHCVYRSNATHQHYWITFAAQQPEGYLDLFFRRNKGRDNLIRLTEDQLLRLCEVLQELLKQDTDPLRKRICFLQIFELLRLGSPAEYVGLVPGLPVCVQTAIHYMEEHLTENIGVRELAACCNVSINTLERQFKEGFGMTPTAMLRKKRLIESTRFLREGSTVAEAAMNSGFPDYSNYIQIFRHHYGMTPLQYKKEAEKIT